MEKRERTGTCVLPVVDVLTGTVELTHVESGKPAALAELSLLGYAGLTEISAGHFVLRAFSCTREMKALRAITLLAPAKINLYLGVGAIRPDGYHDVTTVLQALVRRYRANPSLRRAFGLHLGGSGQCPPTTTSPTEQRLRFAEEFSVAPRAVIEIEKRTPPAGSLRDRQMPRAVIVGLAGRQASSPIIHAASRRPWLGRRLRVLHHRGSGADDRSRRPARALCRMLRRMSRWSSRISRFNRGSIRSVRAARPCLHRVRHRWSSALEAGEVVRLAASLSNNLTGASASLVPERSRHASLVSASSQERWERPWPAAGRRRSLCGHLGFSDTGRPGCTRPRMVGNRHLHASDSALRSPTKNEGTREGRRGGAVRWRGCRHRPRGVHQGLGAVSRAGR